jgi:hypothetical protein
LQKANLAQSLASQGMRHFGLLIAFRDTHGAAARGGLTGEVSADPERS